MLKALIRKHYMESFRTYFVSAKTGKPRGKFGIAGMFVMFGVLMLFLCGVFFGMSYGVGETLFGLDMAWMYFTLMGFIAMLLGTFGSVFNTFAALYLPRDNELLLSMPIPPHVLLTARIALVYGLALLYSGAVWLPALAVHWIFGSPTAASVVFGILLTFVIALFVTVLTCALGWVVALIAARVKNKSFLTLLLTLLFLGAYWFFCMNMYDIMQKILVHITRIGEFVRQWAGFLCRMGDAACGDAGAMLIFTGITAALTAVTLFVLARSFVSIAVRNSEERRAPAKKAVFRAAGLKRALLRREWKRFTSSATYMLNSALGILILPILAVLMLTHRTEIRVFLFMFTLNIPEVKQLLPLAIMGIVCLITGMDMVSTPSVSLEGKHLWILKSLPAEAADILDAKLNLHVLVNVWSSVFAAAAGCWCITSDVPTILLVTAFVWLYVWFSGAFGLSVGLLRPNFNWTSEVMPIKQSLNVLIVMLGELLAAVLFCGAYWFLKDIVDLRAYLAGCVLLMGGIVLGLRFWLRHAGAERFRAL